MSPSWCVTASRACGSTSALRASDKRHRSEVMINNASDHWPCALNGAFCPLSVAEPETLLVDRA